VGRAVWQAFVGCVRVLRGCDLLKSRKKSHPIISMGVYCSQWALICWLLCEDPLHRQWRWPIAPIA